jgi:hypothetical protein
MQAPGTRCADKDGIDQPDDPETDPQGVFQSGTGPQPALWLPDITILLSAACMPLMALF